MTLHVLTQPRAALASAVNAPLVTRRALVLGVVVVVLGCLTLPRQLPALAVALLGPDGPPHGPFMMDGLRRLVVLDRLVPPLTPLLAAVLVFHLASAWLPTGAAGRRSLIAVLVVGLAPLVVLRAGELITVWLVPFEGMRAGDVISAPRLFATGPLLFSARDAVTASLDLLDARMNLVVLWMLGLWVAGLRQVEGGRWAGWHVGVPVVAWVTASAFTWWLAAPVAALVLGKP